MIVLYRAWDYGVDAVGGRFVLIMKDRIAVDGNHIVKSCIWSDIFFEMFNLVPSKTQWHFYNYGVCCGGRFVLIMKDRIAEGENYSRPPLC